MQAPPDDWGHWFPFVQHNPVLGDKKSWRDRAELLRRLERDGIIVAKGILDARECAELAEDMGGWLKRQGIDCNDNKTWDKYNAANLHMSKSILGMMNTGPACFSSVALKARSSPKVVEIFKVLHDVPSEDDLVMQLQGLFWGFPPEHYPGGFIPPQEGAPSNQGGYYHWSEMWMHSDRGRSTTYPAPLQCTLVLEDVSLYDHGFVFLSKSHYYHDEFFASHPPGTLELEPRSLLPPTTPVAAGSAAMRQQQQQQQQQQQLLQEEGKDTYIQLTYENVKYFEQKGCQWKKVVAPKGSIIIWDSRLIHSTCAPSRGRPFPRARFIVFGGYVPRADLTEEEKAERARNFQRYCQGIDHQILLELWQRGPPGRLRRLMGLEEPGGEGSVGGLTSVGSGMSGGSAEEGEEEGEQERKKEGCGGVTEERKLIGGRIHHQEEGERKEEQQKMAMIKLKGLEGAWSWKEKEAANALLVMMRPNKQKR